MFGPQLQFALCRQRCRQRHVLGSGTHVVQTRPAPLQVKPVGAAQSLALHRRIRLWQTGGDQILRAVDEHACRFAVGAAQHLPAIRVRGSGRHTTQGQRRAVRHAGMPICALEVNGAVLHDGIHIRAGRKTLLGPVGFYPPAARDGSGGLLTRKLRQPRFQLSDRGSALEIQR